jgi:hypothetical protein
MPDEQTEFVALKDEAGQYYMLSREELDQARVADEDKAELDQILAGDTSGFAAGFSVLPSQQFSLLGGLTVKGAIGGQGSPAYLPSLLRRRPR